VPSTPNSLRGQVGVRPHDRDAIAGIALELGRDAAPLPPVPVEATEDAETGSGRRRQHLTAKRGPARPSQKVTVRPS
jgi:hypothetical protein